MILLLEYNNRIREGGWVIGERRKEKERKTKTGHELGNLSSFLLLGWPRGVSAAQRFVLLWFPLPILSNPLFLFGTQIPLLLNCCSKLMHTYFNILYLQ